MGVVYDAGALLAGERNDRRMWAVHAELLARDIAPTIPAPVLAQAWRGGARQASLARMLRQCEVEAMTEDHAREVGGLLGASDTSDVVDAAVVAVARRRQATAILTADPGDLQRIADALGFNVTLEMV